MLEYKDGKFISDNGEGKFEVDSVTVLRYTVDRYIEFLKEKTNNEENREALDFYNFSRNVSPLKDIAAHVINQEMSRLMEVTIKNCNNLRIVQYVSMFICNTYYAQIFEAHNKECAMHFFFLIRDRSFRLFLKKKRMDTAPYFFFAFGFYKSWGLNPCWIYDRKEREYVPRKGSKLGRYPFKMQFLMDQLLCDYEDGTNYIKENKLNDWKEFEHACVAELTEIPSIISQAILEQHSKGLMQLTKDDESYFRDMIAVHDTLCIELQLSISRKTKDIRKGFRKSLRKQLRDEKTVFGDLYKYCFEDGYFAACYLAAMITEDGISRRRITKAVNVEELAEKREDKYHTYIAPSDIEYIDNILIKIFVLVATPLVIIGAVHLGLKAYNLYLTYGIDAVVFAVAGIFGLWCVWTSSPTYIVEHGGHVGCTSDGKWFTFY